MADTTTTPGNALGAFTNTNPSAPGATPSNVAPMPTSITSNFLTQQTPISLPTPPPVDTGMATNASIPSPLAIVQQNAAPTAAEGQQSDILQRIADLTGNGASLATYQTGSEGNAGIPAMTKTVNDLTTQLSGLNDQASYLANIAPTTIQNQEQQAATGRGITAGGLAPLTSADLRNNQIKQAGIAAQALTVKSALYAAQGNLSLAKDAADKAAQVQFDAQQQEIQHQQALLAAIGPQLTKDQQARAAVQSAQLADRQKQIENQRQDFLTGHAAVADALKNNPDNPAAQEAAKMAANLDPNDPQYLQKVQQLVAPYASDVAVRALDIQSKKGQIALQQGQIAQLPLDAALKGAQIANLGTQKQDSYEKQFTTTLEKEFSARSGSLGVQSQKVDQAIHLRTLLDQYAVKDANGNIQRGPDGKPTYNVPPSQYAELAQGMASLLSGNNSLSDSRVADIQQQSVKGDIGKLLTYVTGTNYSGSSRDILNNLSDSIDRQGGVADQLRNQYVTRLQRLAPTGLDPARRDALINEQLPSYQEALQGKYDASSGAPAGTTLMTGPDGKDYNVPNNNIAAFVKAGGKAK